MVGGLSEAFELAVFARAEVPGHASHVVPGSPWARRLYRVPVLRRRRDWLTLVEDLHFDRAVAARLPEGHIFQGVVGQCTESLLAARGRGYKATVLDVVNVHVDELAAQVERESARFGLRSFIHPRMRQRILDEYRSADLLRVMSERARGTFLERGFAPDRVFVAQPPFDLADFPRATFDNPRFRISFVGLPRAVEGLPLPHRGVRPAPGEGRGAGPVGRPGARSVSRYLLERMAANPGILLRPVEVRRAGLAEVYGKSHVLVHPSLSDGFGLVVGEAMACGVPVIVADRAGAADLVKDGQKRVRSSEPRRGRPIRDTWPTSNPEPGLVAGLEQAARETYMQQSQPRGLPPSASPPRWRRIRLSA